MVALFNRAGLFRAGVMLVSDSHVRLMVSGRQFWKTAPAGWSWAPAGDGLSLSQQVVGDVRRQFWKTAPAGWSWAPGSSCW